MAGAYRQMNAFAPSIVVAAASGLKRRNISAGVHFPLRATPAACTSRTMNRMNVTVWVMRLSLTNWLAPSGGGGDGPRQGSLPKVPHLREGSTRMRPAPVGTLPEV